jgi:hypothetical protein
MAQGISLRAMDSPDVFLAQLSARQGVIVHERVDDVKPVSLYTELV